MQNVNYRARAREGKNPTKDYQDQPIRPLELSEQALPVPALHRYHCSMAQMLRLIPGMTVQQVSFRQPGDPIYGTDGDPEFRARKGGRRHRFPLPTIEGDIAPKDIDRHIADGILFRLHGMNYSPYSRLGYFCLRDQTEPDRAPVLIAVEDSHNFWLFGGKVYKATDLELTSEDVLALVNEASNRRRLQLEKAHALQAMTEHLDGRVRRQSIPQDVKVLVWQRDKGRCVECDSNRDLEFDHVIPLSLGGSNTVRNLQLLCEVCNRRKGATLG